MTDAQAKIMAREFAACLFGHGRAGQPFGHLRLLVEHIERMVGAIERAADRVGK